MGRRRISVHRVVSVHISAQLFVLVFFKLVNFLFSKNKKKKESRHG